jgi:hypothetical protein
VRFDGDVKSDLKKASWHALCTNPDFEHQRLEIGFIFAQLLEIHAQKVMDSIGHPVAAFKDAAHYRADSEQWEHWAIVSAGHMLGV